MNQYRLPETIDRLAEVLSGGWRTMKYDMKSLNADQYEVTFTPVTKSGEVISRDRTYTVVLTVEPGSLLTEITSAEEFDPVDPSAKKVWTLGRLRALI